MAQDDHRSWGPGQEFDPCVVAGIGSSGTGGGWIGFACMARIQPLQKPGWLMRLVNLVMTRRLGRAPRQMGILGYNPRILAAFVAYGAFFESSKRVPANIKRLAHLRVAMRVGCPS